MLLEAVNVGFGYQKNSWTFRHIDLSVARGEIVGLVGPSGSGKTTLGRILAGYEKPLEGAVKLNGSPLTSTGYHPVQLVFQHPEKAVNPKWRMKDILHEGWNPDDKLLERLGIEQDWLRRWPNELSGGELQRFCVARALGPQTQFLIADEMTTMLDSITQAQIWQVVLDMAKERNMGILVISHEAPLLNRLCSRIIDISQVK
ncbi:ATP-binding cassette domain-containing protein [Neobacillus sp. YX16]|uniref:ABC transporter ATP-binding protein n=1 Tax=Neobacillus sp. YX16 TaxID=3047874 RepID=UPI0024C2D6D2|nr:ATP-binding cassette domain-containing protein [Neobacillus sp. YX16]WHZ03111.1 ATP-binding cassette domain-containing protein [Neobacillus sp. YX16]